MAARWSFEALAVEQYKNNKYERFFFSYEMKASQNIWYSDYLIYELKKNLQQCQREEAGSNEFRNSLSRLNFYLDYLSGIAGFKHPDNLKTALTDERFDTSTVKNTSAYLDLLAKHFRDLYKYATNSKDSVSDAILRKIGSEGLITLKEKYYNNRLADFLLNRDVPDKSFKTPDRIIQKYEPVNMNPVSKYGRAHFYAPYKQIGNIQIDTFWFNLSVLWFVTFLLYLALYFNLLQKLVTYFEKLKFPKSN